MALELDLYSDEWIRLMRPDGVLQLAVRTLHVCLAGANSAWGPCGTLVAAFGPAMHPGGMMLESMWRRPRWHCNCCGACLRAKFGTVTQIWHNGDLFWMRSHFPATGPLMDAASFEETGMSTANLAQMIEQTPQHPTQDTMIRLPRAEERSGAGPELGWYKVVDTEAFLSMTVWEWADVVAFTKHLSDAAEAAEAAEAGGE